ncbi:MAG TPA: Ig-like domain-containing protein [Actinomycetes bacterium]|nr:Ig-like domain-containing protein [Actinomycetes bacterium]
MTNPTTTRRPLTRLAALLVGTALSATGLVVVTGTPVHAATHDTVTTTPVTAPNLYTRRENTLDLHVPDSGPADTYPGTMTFVGVPGVITDMTVRLESINHAHLDDLDVMLVGPTGIKIKLLSDAGGGALSWTSLAFHDNAAGKVGDGTSPTGGSYLPSDWPGDDTFPAPAPTAAGAATSFAAFNGTSPNGTWKLYVVDDFAQDQGVISGWTIIVGTNAPVPASQLAVSGVSGTVTDVDVDLRGFTAICGHDADLLLVGPQGQRSMLMSDTADCTDTGPVDLRVDDEAPGPFTSDVPGSGSYRPTDVDDAWDFSDPFPGLGDVDALPASLSVFDGADPNGTWRLYVVNDAPDTVVSLAGGWGLHLTTTDPASAQTPSGATTPIPTAAAPTTPGTTASAAPRITGSTPKAGVKGVRRGAVVKATFTAGMKASTLTRSTVRLTRKGSTKLVTAKVSYLAGTRTVVLDPATRLAAGATYRFVVTTGATSQGGRALDQVPSKAGNQRFAMTFRTR